MRLKVYLMGVVRGLSLVSRTKTASSFAGSVFCVAADRMDRARRFGPALACPIDARAPTALGSDGADHKQSCQGDSQDTDDPHDTVPCVGEPVAFELSQVLFPVVSVCGLRAPRTVNRVATTASPPYPSAICGSENALESWPEMRLGKAALL